MSFDTVPGNIHDSVSFFGAYRQLQEKFGDQIKNVCLDAGYKTPAIAKEILDNHQQPILPYKRPQTKKGFFPKNSSLAHEDWFESINNHYMI